ncbi:MAG: hypothetical protein ACLQMH_17195 [Solirubrobacteraceae bacterium]
MGRIGACRSKLGGGRRAHSPLGWIGVALLLSLSLGACGSSKTSANNAVPATGTVAGKGYAYWLEHVLQHEYATTSSRTPPFCSVVSVGGQRVAWLGFDVPSGAVTCSEPEDRGLYVEGLWGNCSTLTEDHSGFSTTSAELEKCARSNFEKDFAGVSHGVTLDGRLMRSVVTATGVFYVPKVVSGGLCSYPCLAEPTAHAAGYGSGLLLSELSKGTHVIHITTGAPDNVSVTFTIHVS